jgi:membrane protease YdiL (CAAX protease family)
MISSSSTPQTGMNSSRLGLRVLIGFVILYMAIFIVNLVVGVGPNLLMRWLDVSPNVRAFAGSTFSYAVRIAAVCILPALALKIVLGMDPWSTFFPFRNDWWKDLLFGFLLVAVILYGLFFFEVRAGWLVVEGWNWQILPFDVFVRTVWVGLLVNVSVATGEETVFRGYLLKGLKTTWGGRAGLVVMMIIFGSFHLPAYIEGGLHSGTLTLAILLATLFGGLFGLAYLRTQSLWLPVSLHFAWNFVENDLFNLSADRTNVNLIGALTRLQSPLSMTELQFGNVILVEMLMFAIIALGVWLWLKPRRVENTPLST